MTTRTMDNAATQNGSAAGTARDAGTRSGSLCVRTAPVSAVREDAREADFVCSTDTRDSYGEIVRQNWNLNRFAGNPVALWSHQSHELPIGFWKNVRVEDGSLRGTLVVATAEANPKAENVWQSILQKTIRAVSVGFQPGKVTVEEIDGDEVVCLDDNTLFEISPTPLPANPEALIDARRKAFGDFYATRGAVPYEAHPAADTGKWDASAAVKRLRAWASDGKGSDHIDWNKYRQGFAWVDPQRTHEFGGYKLPHHDVKDGKLITPRAGVIAAGDALAGSRGGLKIPEADRPAVKKHLAQHYHQFDMKAPWENKSATAAGSSSGVATLDTTTGPAPAKKKEPGVAKTKEEMEEEAKKKSMVTCPECGEKFDPEDDGDGDEDKAKHAKAYKERLATLIVERSAPVIAERDSLKASVADLQAKHTLAASERDAARAQADALSLKLVEAELIPLSGVKYAPGAHDGHVAIAKMYLSQGDAGQVKWKAHLDAIKGGPDLKILGAPITPADPTPNGSQPTGDLTDLLNKSLSDKE